MTKLTPPELLKLHDETCALARSIMVRKNADYGADADALKNFRASEAFGVRAEIGIMVRLSDKFTRIGNGLQRELQVKDETLDDTLVDAVNYLILLRAALHERTRATPQKLTLIMEQDRSIQAPVMGTNRTAEDYPRDGAGRVVALPGPVTGEEHKDDLDAAELARSLSAGSRS